MKQERKLNKMQAKVKLYLETLVHGVIEGMGFFPIFLLVAVLTLSKEEIILWYLGLLLIFFISFVCRNSLTKYKSGISLAVAVVIVLAFSLVAFNSLWARIVTVLVGGMVAYRGIQHADNDWEQLMPSRIFWMVSIPIYFVGYITFALNDHLVMYEKWISIAGLLFIILMVLITNKEQLNYASHSKQKHKRVKGTVKRFNQVYLLIILSLVFLISNFQVIQSTIFGTVRNVIGALLNKETRGNSNAGMDAPDSGGEIDLELGDPAQENALPQWVDNLLWIIGTVIVIVIVLAFMAMIFKRFRGILRSFLAWFLNLFTSIFKRRQQGDEFVAYEDEKESLFDFRKVREGMKDNYQKILRKITKRKPKFDHMSIEEKVRYIYRFLASEVKEQEKWRASLTAHEVLQLNERKKKLERFKNWYDDIRYGKLDLKEAERKQVDDLWLDLQ